MSALDKAFQAKFSGMLLRTIMEASLVGDVPQGLDTPGAKTVMIPAGEVIETMITAMAMLMRDSEETSSPTKTRAACDGLAAKLRRRIVAAKEADSPFATVLPSVH